MGNWIARCACLGVAGLCLSSSPLLAGQKGNKSVDSSRCSSTLSGEDGYDAVVSPTEFFVPNSDFESRVFFHRRAGSDDTGPVIVFIPGGPGLSSNMLYQMERLTRSFDIALVDPPGTGKGVSSPPFMEYTGREIYDRVVESIARALLEQFGGRRQLVLVGHSFGGLYAADLLVQQMTKKSVFGPVAGVVFISTPLLKSTFDDHMEKQRRRYAPESFFEAREQFFGEVDIYNYIAWVTSHAELIFAPNYRATGLTETYREIEYASPESMVFIRKRWPKREEEFTGYLRVLRRVADRQRAEGVKDAFRILYVGGKEDRLIAPEEQRRNALEAGVETIRMVTGAGHMLPMEGPEILARFIEENFMTGP